MRWGLLALAAGCGASSANAPLHKFPSQEELLRMQQAQRPAKVLSETLVSSAGWAPVTAPAEAVAQGGYEDPSPAGQALGRLATERGLRLSRGLRCVAEEAGQFYLKRRAFPGEGLRRFLAARCGSLMTSPMLSSYTADGAAELLAGPAQAEWSGRVDRWLRETLRSREEQVGLWSGQEAGHVVVMVAHDTPLVSTTAQPLVPDAEGKVVVRGTVNSNAEHVAALVNQGTFGVAECARDLRLRLPQFGFICPLAQGDGRAWVQVTAQPPQTVLADTVLELLLHRAPEDVARYTLPDASPSGQVDNEAAFTAALMPVLNQARQDAGLQPLVLAEQQSQTAQALAPHFFVASRGGARQMQERIALGLMAGWQVGGAIRGGDLVASVTGPARDPREWLATTLESPVGRRVLLGRDSRRIAVGPLLSREPSGLGALVTTYRFFEGPDHKIDEEQVLGDLAELRRQHGVPGSVVLVRDLSDTMKGLAQQQLRSGQAPTEVFRAMLEQIVGRMNMSAHGYLFQTTDLSNTRFPEELWRRKGQLPVAVTIAHHKPPGAAWAHLVVFLIALQPGPEA